MIKCEKCGREIKDIVTSVFNWNGGEYRTEYELAEYPVNAISFDTDENWCGYDLEEDEQAKHIECPYCHEYPFKNKEIQIHRIVRVVMFKDKE